MKKILNFFILILIAISSKAQYYYPTSIEWDTTSVEELSWCQDSLKSLINYVESENSKAFIILHKGKIVTEKYYGNFTADSLWYWASAGKTITAYLVGKAQEEGFLSIDSPTSKYLGEGWTTAPKDKERLITLRNQLTMTTGLDFNVDNLDCTDPECLKYYIDADKSWYYHNAPYTLLQPVLVSATGKTANVLTSQYLKNTIGMDGIWINANYNNVYYSKARDMARFGLLMLSGGKWNGTQLIKDTSYFNDMINTSNPINPSYGYLWWLNGKDTAMVPGFTQRFPVDLIPEAPKDLYAALGKNDQKIYVVPSKDLVIVRMGNAAGEPALAPSSFDNELWKRISRMENCKTIGMKTISTESKSIYPNPAENYVVLPKDLVIQKVEIYSVQGSMVQQNLGKPQNSPLDISSLHQGIYLLKLYSEEGCQSYRLVKQ
jgi:CubicO group peptidase (beta-lactamase class C family)